jgi:hypothetical protein
LSIFGEDFLAGFFEDDTTKKPVVAQAVAAAVPAPVVPAAIVPQTPAVVIVPEPAKVPAEIINEVDADDVTEAILPAEIPSAENTGEKLVETVTDMEAAASMPEKVEVTVPEKIESVSEVVAPVASTDVLTNEVPAASEVPAVVAPVKETSEEEGLLEGLVNTLILDDGDDGKY